MAVAVVDDDLAIIEILQAALRLEGFEVLTATSGTEAVRLCTTAKPMLAVVDLRLPDVSGLDVLRMLHLASVPTKVAIMTACASIDTVMEALRLGASDYLEKPVDIDRLVRLVVTITAQNAAASELSRMHVCHAAARWAAVVVRVIDAPEDPKSVVRWARWIAVSPGALRNWCRTVGIPSKRSLDFARVLRAVVRRRHGDQPQDLLDVADRRTLAHLLRLGGCRPASNELPPTLDQFLERQQWVTSANVLKELETALVARRVEQCDKARDTQ